MIAADFFVVLAFLAWLGIAIGYLPPPPYCSPYRAPYFSTSSPPSLYDLDAHIYLAPYEVDAHRHRHRVPRGVAGASCEGIRLMLDS